MVELKWKRPASFDYPKIWHKFTAKDVDSDRLVEYFIADLPESQHDEALKMLTQDFCKDEPMCEAYDFMADAAAVEDFVQYWKPILKQKTVLACYRHGSDEIVGLQMNYVLLKDEHFVGQLLPQFKSTISVEYSEVLNLLYEDYHPCEHYGADKYLTSAGLIVSSKYRGRRVGEHLLRARDTFCPQFGIKLTTTIFTSAYSNRIADKTGFKLDKSISFEDIRRKHPNLLLPPVKSDVMTLKSIVHA